jgi:hypothetical protein
MNEKEKAAETYILKNVCAECASKNKCDKTCILGDCCPTLDVFPAFMAGFEAGLFSVGISD